MITNKEGNDLVLYQVSFFQSFNKWRAVRLYIRWQS